MRRPLVLAASAAALLALPACHSPHVTIDYGTRGPTVLAAGRLDDGSAVTWRLSSKGSELHRSVDAVVRRPRSGLTVATIDAETGARHGCKPWTGVLVTDVAARSAAATAGVARGDIVLALAEEELASEQEWLEVLQQRMRLDSELVLVVLGPTGATGAREQRAVAFLPDSESVTETRLDSFPLRTSSRLVGRAGLHLGEVEPAQAGQVWGGSRPVVLITDVMTGSPAYLAGLRRGDRVVRCQGATEPDLEAVLAAAGVSRARRPADDGDGATDGDVERLALEVDGPLGWHSADVGLAEDLDDTTEFDFPILFEWESSTRRLHWAFLDFILQFGATYSRSYSASSDREPVRWSKLSFLPFGMFEFERHPRGRTWTFLWFIEWSSS